MCYGLRRYVLDQCATSCVRMLARYLIYLHIVNAKITRHTEYVQINELQHVYVPCPPLETSSHLVHTKGKQNEL